MEILQMKPLKRNIFIFLLIAFTYSVELLILSRPSDGLHSILITLAFAMVTVYLTDYKSSYGIFLGFFVIAFLDTIIFFDLVFWFSLLIAFFTAFFYTLACIAFSYLFSFSKDIAPLHIKSILIFTGTIIFAFNVAIIVPTIAFSDYTHGVKPIDVYFNDFLAGISGMLSFGMIVLFDNWLKVKELYSKKEIFSFIFASVLFSTFLIFLFSNTFEWVTINLGYSIIIVFYLIFSYYYHFRSLLLFNFIYILISRLLYFDFIVETDTVLDIAGFDILLAILSFIFIISKLIIHYLETQNDALEKANNKLEVILDSTMSLIKLSDTINTKYSDYTTQYLHNVFGISSKIFSNFDYAFLIEKHEKKVKFVDALKYNFDKVSGIELPHILINWKKKEPVLVNKPQEYIQNILGTMNFSSFRHLPKTKQGIYITIFYGDEAIGAIAFLLDEKSDTTITKEIIANIASFQQTVNSITEVTELNKRTNTLKDEVVLSMVRTLELFDAYTGGHSEQVAYLAFNLALKLNIPRKQATEIYWAGIVHDIGKIGVGYDIINKKGNLTPEEYEAIKMHPVYGYDILIKSNELKEIASLVRHHHEWYNGSGYPDGIKNSNIPYGAQILTVADAVSSMSTSRPYSKIKDNTTIIYELELYCESQFNPEIAKAMIKLINDGIIEDSLT